uniref:SpoIIE family protein phosphatase n=1 Tax=Acetatifactor sp. TaxID=1872090 RepID=UPI0040563C47
MVLTSKIEQQKKEQAAQVTELCRQKLLGYAESFQELAKSFNGGFEGNASDRQSMLEEWKHWENKKVICDNLNELAQIMEKVATEELRFLPIESRKRKMILRELREEGIIADNVCYFPCSNGKNAVGMTLRTVRKEELAAEEIADMMSVLLERPLRVSAVSPYLVDSKCRSFIFVEEANYIALTGFAKVVRENEIISGDSYAFLESEKGKLTMLLSDGTGSGEKASRDSGRVLDLLEKMLEAGYGMNSAISLINSALYAKGEDSDHPTIDICNLDLYRGKCEFYKVGGAISFLKRGEKVEIISGGSLPLGIFRNIEVQSISKELQDEDYLIMMSDGVLDAFDNDNFEEWMSEAISGITEQNPGEIAERLLHLAICACEGHIGDDMTVLVAGVWKNNGIT